MPLRHDRPASGRAAPLSAAPGPLRLTGAGQAFLAGGTLLAAFGWGAGYPEPVVLGAALLFAVAVAILWTLPGPGVAAVRDLSPPHTVRGEHATATVTLRRDGRRVRHGLRLADSCDDIGIDMALPIPAPGSDHTVRYRVPTPHRGRMTVGPLRVIVTDPFGLCRRAHQYGDTGALTVRPRTVPLGVPASGRNPLLDGPSSTSTAGAPSAFHALRPYVPGDDRRMVHWRSSARTGSLIVRQMSDVSRPQTTVLLDADPAHYPDGPEDPAGTSGDRSGGGSADMARFELAVDVCASVAATAARSAFPVRVLIGPERLPAASDDVGAILDGLAGVRPDAAPDSLHTAVGLLKRDRGGGALVVVTGSAADASVLRHIASARQTFSRVLIVRVGADRGSGSTRPVAADDGFVLDIAELSTLPAAWHRVDRASRGKAC